MMISRKILEGDDPPTNMGIYMAMALDMAKAGRPGWPGRRGPKRRVT